MREQIEHAFLERYAIDGDRLSLAEYQALWPGFEDVVARAYEAVRRPKDPGTIAHYRVEGEIGRGAQGVVYRAVDEKLGRTVALKVLRRGPGDDVRTILRFQREAQAASRLEHPGICTVYESGVADGDAYIAMQFVEGETLAGRKHGNRDELLALLERTARALHAAHEAGVVHRDLKPHNIMVQPDGQPVVLDFGLAGGRDGAFATLTATGDVFGTPFYMAPEQLEPGDRPPDRTADVYALGVCLFEAVTGRRPFEATSLDGLYHKILRAPFPDSDLPRDLAVICQTAMERDRDRRYPTALAFAEDLRRVREHEPIHARPAPWWLRAQRWSERNRVLATAMLGSLVVLGTALGITLWQGDDAAYGREMRQREEVEELLRRGFQIGFGLESERAKPIFEEALVKDPDSATAFVGRVLMEMPDRDAARRVFDRAGGLADDPDIAWLRGFARDESELPPDSGTDLRAFLEGHRAVRNFQPPVDPAAAKKALGHFREAVMRSPRPRYHHYHSWMMAAHHARDVPAMEEAERAMLHHWPDAAATHEAIAQFFHVFDRDKARRAMHRILEIEPSGAAHIGLGVDARTGGDDDRALHHFEEATRLSPGLAHAHFMFGAQLEKMGRHQRAVAAYARAAATPPAYFRPVALQALLARLGANGDADATARTLRALVEKEPALREPLEKLLATHPHKDALR